jgi:hypothetical protein
MTDLVQKIGRKGRVKNAQFGQILLEPDIVVHISVKTRAGMGAHETGQIVDESENPVYGLPEGEGLC